jgi:hypothetical protein
MQTVGGRSQGMQQNKMNWPEIVQDRIILSQFSGDNAPCALLCFF